MSLECPTPENPGCPTPECRRSAQPQSLPPQSLQPQSLPGVNNPRSPTRPRSAQFGVPSRWSAQPQSISTKRGWGWSKCFFYTACRESAAGTYFSYGSCRPARRHKLRIVFFWGGYGASNPTQRQEARRPWDIKLKTHNALITLPPEKPCTL